jgi:hypothetical protein
MFILAVRGDSAGNSFVFAKINLARFLYFGTSAFLAAGAILFLRWLSLPEVDSGAIQGFATRAASKMIFESSFFQRWDYFKPTLTTDWISWLLILCGLAVALVRSRRAAICALSLLPLLFYRNAFPYFYVVMLAPAAVLAAFAFDALRDLAGRGSPGPAWIPVAVSLPLIFQAAINLADLRLDRQENQRLTIDAVHQIFPEPVPYIDHSGMVSSFPKVNFFMSTWGIEDYRNRGTGFVQQAIDTYRPPMLLANTAVLLAGTESFGLLLEDDRRLIEAHYLQYWGAIFVAGARMVLDSAAEVSVELPFPGRYRVESDVPVNINGAIYANDSIIDISEGIGFPVVTVQRIGFEPVNGRLVWAAARPRPAGSLPPFAGLYSSL